MIMLIESVPITKGVFFRKQVISVEKVMVLGMKVMIMTVHIPFKLRTWQKDRLKKRVIGILSKLRINTVCVKSDFPYPEWFNGYRILKGNELINRFLGKIAVMSGKRHNTIYVHINRCDRNSFKALTDLCQSFRHIILSGRNTDIANRLYETYGASVIVAPTPERIITADVAIFFEEPSEMPDFNKTCVIIQNNDSLNVEFGLTNGESVDIPDGYPHNAIINEAILHGCLRFEDIFITKSEISP